MQTTIDPPSIRECGPFVLSGILRRHDSSNAAMPAQWQEFAPHIGHIPGQITPDAWAVIITPEQGPGCDYLTAVEVTPESDTMPGFTCLTLPRRRYAVFIHRGHVSGIGATWKAIRNEWAPGSAERIARAPELERYTAAFNPMTGSGETEVWIPLEG